jgi:hypothetical protein
LAARVAAPNLFFRLLSSVERENLQLDKRRQLCGRLIRGFPARAICPPPQTFRLRPDQASQRAPRGEGEAGRRCLGVEPEGVERRCRGRRRALTLALAAAAEIPVEQESRSTERSATRARRVAMVGGNVSQT